MFVEFPVGTHAVERRVVYLEKSGLLRGVPDWQMGVGELRVSERTVTEGDRVNCSLLTP